MTIISCPGCERRLDASEFVCPDCKTVLRKQPNGDVQQQKDRVEAAEARFKANAEAAGIKLDVGSKPASFGEHYAAAKAQRVVAEKRMAVVRDKQSVVITDLDVPMGRLFVFSLKLMIAMVPAMLLTWLFFALVLAGAGSWLSLLH